MRRRLGLLSLVASVTWLILLGKTWAAPGDCGLANDYYALAQKAEAEADDESRRGFLKQASEVCPSYLIWQELGDASAELGESAAATAAYAEAYTLAANPKDQAKTIAAWARVVFRDGDPQRAQQKIVVAIQLDPGNAEIAALADEIQGRIDAPLVEDIRRGWAETLFADLATAPSIPSSEPLSDAAAPAQDEPQGVASINITINFDFNSTRVDAASGDNVRVLAEAMMSTGSDSTRFRLVGHADSRGTVARNNVLSEDRARAVRDLLVRLEPQLNGRLEVQGMGSNRPLVVQAETEAEHRKNRRLEVFRL